MKLCDDELTNLIHYENSNTFRVVCEQTKTSLKNYASDDLQRLPVKLG